MLKQMISLLLCLAMVISMVPAQAFATETTTGAAEQIAETESVMESSAPKNAAADPTEESAAPEDDGAQEPSVPAEPVTDAAEETIAPTEETTLVESPESYLQEEAQSALENTYIAKGTLSNGINWTIKDDGNMSFTLDDTFTGPQSIPDFASPEERPWHDYKDSIRYITLYRNINGACVTDVGNYAFYECSELRTVFSDVDNVGEHQLG